MRLFPLSWSAMTGKQQSPSFLSPHSMEAEERGLGGEVKASHTPAPAHLPAIPPTSFRQPGVWS